MHGPAAATLAAGGESMVGALRTSKRWTSRIASRAMSATMLFSVAYFMLNTLLVTAVPRLKRSEPQHASDLFGKFGWMGLAFGGSAAMAALLFLMFRQSGIGVLMAVVPILAMLPATLHCYFRNQETHQAVRDAGAQAAEREAESA